MYKVEKHNNSKEYFKGLNIEDNTLVITSNTSLSYMIRENANVEPEKRWRIVDIENFMNRLYPKWSDKSNKVKFKGEVRKAIIKIRKELEDNASIKELNFIEDNIDLLMEGLEQLIFSGVKRIEKSGNTVKLKLIEKIYSEIEGNDFVKSISGEILNLDTFKDLDLKEINIYVSLMKKKNNKEAEILERKLKLNRKPIEKIVFYNINNIGLERFMTVEMLKLCGYEVIFRIPYFDNFNIVNKSWDMVYGSDDLFKFTNEKSVAKKEEVKYLKFIEGQKMDIDTEENINIKNYREIYDFKKGVNKNMVVTFYKGSLSSCIYKDDLNNSEHCYATSIGRFLFNLYKCKVDDKNIKIDFTTYKEMITSGWIEYKEWNGSKLFSYLSENEDYYSGVSTLDEIIERIEKIKDIEEVSGIFEESAKNRIKKNNLKAFLSNPFRAFGYANMEKYNITANYMLEVTLRLKRFLLAVFENEEGLINLEKHFNLITILFRGSKHLVEVYSNGSEIEKTVLRKIYAILNNPKDFGDYLHRDEIADLFSIHLSLTDNSIEEDDQEQDFSLEQLDGILLRDSLYNYSNRRKICISDLSFKAYEKTVKSHSLENKVLSIDEILAFTERNLVGRNKESVTSGLTLQKLSNKAYESYIKFTFSNLFINFDGEIELSWIEGLREDDSKAIILKQIEAIYENVEEVRQGLSPEDMIDEDELTSFREPYYDEKKIKENIRKLPEVSYRDLDFCGDKFLYSSLIEDYPMYYSEFHHKLVFTSLVSMIKNSVENGYGNIYRYILPLFPQWEDVVKKNVLDCEFARKSFKEYKFFDGINYPKNIDTLYLLKSRYIVTENNKIRNRYNKGDFEGEKYVDEFIKEYLVGESINNGLHCKMCPHCYVCKKGEFVIDNK